MCNVSLTPLSERVKQQQFIPKGAEWYSKQKVPLVKYHEYKSLGLPAFFVAWDVQYAPADKLSKAFAVYHSKEAFFENLWANPVNRRWGYEVIVQGGLCRSYADIEWMGEKDTGDTVMHEILQLVRIEARKQFEREPKISVTQGSRAAGDSYKNSYHITIANIVYDNNHKGGKMKLFWQGISDIWARSHPEFAAIHEGHGSPIDLTVYSMGRQMRLPGCCKRIFDENLPCNKDRVAVPLQIVSQNPYSDNLTGNYGDGQDMNIILPMIISAPVIDRDTIRAASPEVCPDRIHPVVSPDKVAYTQQRVPLENTTRQWIQRGTETLPFPKEWLQNMLREAGDSVSRVTTVTCTGDSAWRVQCTMSCPRTCLNNKTGTHRHNNCLLFIRTIAEKRSRIEYKCMGTGCRQLMSRHLGDIDWEPSEEPLGTPDLNCAEPPGTQESVETSKRHSQVLGAIQELHCELPQGISGQPSKRPKTALDSTREEYDERNPASSDSDVSCKRPGQGNQTQGVMEEKQHEEPQRIISDVQEEPQQIISDVQEEPQQIISDVQEEPQQIISDVVSLEEQHKTIRKTSQVQLERPKETPDVMEEEQHEEPQGVSDDTKNVKKPHEKNDTKNVKKPHEKNKDAHEASGGRPLKTSETNHEKYVRPDGPLPTTSTCFGRVIDETYEDEHVRRLPIQRAIALRSPCGTGKTKATHELLKELSKKTSISVVWVVHRRALSREAQQKTTTIRRQQMGPLHRDRGANQCRRTPSCHSSI